MKKIYVLLIAFLPLKIFAQCSISVFATDSIMCHGTSDSLIVNNLSADSIASYKWTYSDGTGTHTDTSYNNMYLVNPTQTTKYIVTAYFKSGCTATDSATVNVGAITTPPTFTTSGCSSSDTLSINGGPGGMSYQWYKNGVSTGTSASSYIATTPGAYSATAYYSGCSFSYGPVYYSPSGDPLVLTISQDNYSDTLLYVPSGLDSYQWYKNGVAIAGATMLNYNAGSAGNYTVNTTSYGCSLLSDTITIDSIIKPVITTDGITSCNGVDTLRTQAIGGATYFWSFNGQRVATTSVAFYVAQYSGSYTVTDSMSNSISTTSDAYVVQGLPVPSSELSINYESGYGLCNGDSATLGVPYFSSATYQWYKNDTAVSGATGYWFGIYSSGDYSVVISFAGGCSDTVGTTITQSGSITASLSRNATGDSLVVTASGGITPYNYTPTWTYYQGFEGNEMYIDSAGSYSVWVSDANGCSTVTDTVVVYADSVSGFIVNSSGVFVQEVLVQLLVKHADSSVSVLGSTLTDGYGHYEISTIAAGGYILATPPIDSTQYLPTYYTSSLVIQSATFVNFSSDPLGDTIWLASAAQSSGNGEISGTIDSSSLSGSRKGIVFRTDSAGSSPIAGLKIILLNANNQPVATTYTDANGNFQFTNLANGNYKLWVDGYGINNANAPSVTVNSSSSSISNNLQFAVSGNTLERVSSVTGTTTATLSNAVSVYPNPTTNSFTVSVSGQFGNFTYTLTDQQGRDITTGQGTSTVNTSGLEPGLYIVRVQTAQAVAYQKLIIER